MVAFELESVGHAGFSGVTNSTIARLQISYNARAQMQNARNGTVSKAVGMQLSSRASRQFESGMRIAPKRT